jgi:glycosyltransferase involved in cell wall biosynthesis
MKLSFVIPAYNEEKYLAATLDALKIALANIECAETILVDNESTDSTAEMATTRGAMVVTEHEHNIGRVRNTGVANTTGDVIVFLDADTIVRPGVFEKIVDAVADRRCLGGSVAVEYGPIEGRPLVKAFMLLWPFLGKLTRMRGGALQFCRSEIFRELKGYDTTIYVGEDIDFHWRLDKLAKKRGDFTAFIEEPRVRTSSRRWNGMGLLRMLFFTHPVTIFLLWRVRGVWRDWYARPIR